ncbi:tricarboxylate transporter (plasmid) [Paracoccus liaowanqingii]|uniref:Tricarboxylate transporter n=1 Tax=Paracoccus liaowanqingii TaxID=2560053 RepID=A0A4Y5STD4_9RHOB|nr:tricarboxylate transporter [Paracoccus liaowanqingii]QDA36183.1 tricarboxylate transporter [Paracoccus liaowanqingii]
MTLHARHLGRALAFGALLISQPLTGTAQEAFSPSQVTITVPFAEGGGSDTLVRMITPYLQKTLPGNPAMVVQNQPGGGGLPGTNTFFRSAQNDGSELLAMSSSVFMATLLRDRQVRFEVDKFTPVYLSPLGAVIYVADETGAMTGNGIEGISVPLVYGAASPTSADVLTILALDLLGLDVNPVFGTQRGAARIAFERGEFNVDHQSAAAYSSNVLPLIEAGEAIPLMSFGFADATGEIGRDPAFPEVPTFFELYEQTHGKPLDGPARTAWVALFNASISTGKALVLPQDTPAEVASAYVAALEKIFADPDFITHAKAEIGDYPQSTGEAALAQYSSATTLDEEAFAWLADWYQTKLGVALR